MTTRVEIKNLGPKKIEVLLKSTSPNINYIESYQLHKVLEVGEKTETYVYNYQDVVVKEFSDQLNPAESQFWKLVVLVQIQRR